MCPSTSSHRPAERRIAHDDDAPFPWHLGVCDAHCHPTDEMASVPLIRSFMRVKCLTIMATRSQDQALVDQVARDLGLVSREAFAGSDRPGVVAAFGWHPWFSHQIYDDTEHVEQVTFRPGGDEEAPKRAHYQAVLVPPPTDEEFLRSLPRPVSLQWLIGETRQFLEAHPAALVGEIGLDKAFCLPMAWSAEGEGSRDDNRTPGGREGRLLSPHRVKPAHQQAILEAQLRLAGAMGRAVSVHGVQAHGVLLETVARCWKGHEREVISRRRRRLEAENAHADEGDASSDNDESSSRKGEREKMGEGENETNQKEEKGGKPYPPRICLHSFSAGPEILKQWLEPSIPADMFFSFSVAVNMGTASARSKVAEVVRGVPGDRILVESDWHAAGEEMETKLEEMYRFVCEVKEWSVEEGVTRIRENLERFVFG